MTGKTHRIVGIVCGAGYFLATTSSNYQPATFSAVIIASYFGSLIPDADDAGADIWNTLPMGHSVGKVTDPFIKHRNISHSIVGIFVFQIVLFFLLALVPSYWGISTSIVLVSSTVAYISHLFADMFTVEGVSLFWPWTRKFGIPPKPFEGVRIVTGKWFENLIIFPTVNIILIILLISYWQKIKSLIFK